MYTMGDIARCSLTNEDKLYKMFGINAELLIDHAWGWEPCTMEAIKSYRPDNNSLSSGQVLHEPYTFKKARVVAQEMAEATALDLLDKDLVTDQVILTVGYDRESLEDPSIDYKGEVARDFYGRLVPKHAHGTENLSRQTSSSGMIVQAVLALFDRLVDPDLLIRRITIDVNHVIPEEDIQQSTAGAFEQMDLFTDYSALEKQRRAEDEKLKKERKANEAMLSIKKRFGKNSVIKGINLEEGATGLDRNRQIGGHRE